MNVEVFLTSGGIEDDDIKGRTVVVIDVLRACSTIATALHNGARAVVPVVDMAQAGRIAQNMDPSMFVLGGERAGKKIDGYHVGNSPLEYTTDQVEGRDIILNTTNGTKALRKARGAEHLIVGSFLNAERVVDAIRSFNKDVTLLCAGQDGRVSLEDTLCAGLLLYRLWDGNEPDHATDTAHISFTQYQHDRDNAREAIFRSRNARRLTSLGEEADVDYCLQVDHLNILPYYQDSRIVLKDDVKEAAISSRS